MPKISFLKNRSPIEVAQGAELMKTLLDAGIPVASSCSGDGICAKCKITIIEGLDHLSPENDAEQFLKTRHKLPTNVRISCQTFVQGDITIDTSYW